MALQLYQTLNRDGSIRLIEFNPTNLQDTINISMKVVQLGTVPYLALSYVWGDPENTREITCNGLSLKIPLNLFSALQRVRKRSSNLPIWADAICICQKDIAERGHQVAMMGKIYEQAYMVLVYISDFQKEPSEVVALVQDIKALIQSSGGVHNMNALLDDDPLLLDPRWKSVTLFRQSAWFSRAWVIQEVGMARDPYILYGDCEFSYRDWVLVEVWALKYAPQLLHIWNLLIGTIHPAALDWFQEDIPRNTSFIDLVNTLSILKCTDPRDHVYSLLAYPLARLPSQKGPILVPDYSRAVEDVFMDFTLQLFKFPEGLRLLSTVQHGEKGPPVGQPSWMPFRHLIKRTSIEYKYTLGVCHLHYYNASSGLGDSYHAVTDGNALHLHGIYFDQLASVFKLQEQDFEIHPSDGEVFNDKDVLESIYSTVTDSSSPSPYGSHQDRRDAFSITLTAGFLSRLSGEKIEYLPSHRSDFNSYWKARAQARNPTYMQTDDDHGNAIRSMVDMKLWTRHHSFFITNRGYVGLGPYFAQPGDVCIVFRGGFVPFIVRRNKFDGKFQLIEECYVHGIMRGELASIAERESLRSEEIILH